MDAEFQKALTIVLTLGTLIAGVGALALFFIFRAYGSPRAGRSSHVALIVGLVVFVFLCCAMLFALSYLED